MGNIADGVTEVEIHALFVEYNLQEVRLPRFSDTGGCDMPRHMLSPLVSSALPQVKNTETFTSGPIAPSLAESEQSEP